MVIVCIVLADSHLFALICTAGGGAVEAGLSVYLENFATSLGSREQLAIAEFADALLVIPKTLAVNAAKVCMLGCCLLLGCMFENASTLRSHGEIVA
jgi:chaperonin GroEL (HSP60 family)